MVLITIVTVFWTKTHNWRGPHYISPLSVFIPSHGSEFFNHPVGFHFFLDELPIFMAKFWMKSQFSWHLEDEMPIFMAFGRWNPNFHGKILNEIPIFMAPWMVFMTCSWHFHMSFLASASFRPGQTSSSWESDSCDDGSWVVKTLVATKWGPLDPR